MTRAKWAYLVALVLAVIGPLGIFWIYERGPARPWSSLYLSLRVGNAVGDSRQAGRPSPPTLGFVILPGS